MLVEWTPLGYIIEWFRYLDNPDKIEIGYIFIIWITSLNGMKI